MSTYSEVEDNYLVKCPNKPYFANPVIAVIDQGRIIKLFNFIFSASVDQLYNEEKQHFDEGKHSCSLL